MESLIGEITLDKKRRLALGKVVKNKLTDPSWPHQFLISSPATMTWFDPD